MKINDALIVRINELKEKKGYSQYKLAKASAVPETTLVSINKGRSKSIEVKTIYLLCEGLEITLKDFFDSPLFQTENLQME